MLACVFHNASAIFIDFRDTLCYIRPMTPNDLYKLQGYLHMLEHSPPNGRHIHAVRNKITGLRMLLTAQVAMSLEYEAQVKELVRKLYTID